jgi:hypothetical protein
MGFNQVPFFSGCDEKTVVAISERLHAVTVSPHDLIIRKGYFCQVSAKLHVVFRGAKGHAGRYMWEAGGKGLA